MKFKTLLLLFTLVAHFSFAQNNIKVTKNFGTKNSEIQNLIDFENIIFERLNFEGKDLKGKRYTIILKEFTDGKLVNNSIIFEEKENDYFKIQSNKESILFLLKIADGKLKTFIRTDRFGSKKSYFNLKSDSDEYALKDFFGSKTELNIDSKQETPILAVITPTIHADGSASYCEVVQSNIEPENLGEHFKIPHYFLITIQFK
ncbi:hypothetical protein [Flavobacterium branchiicola]|uniref:Uncharacterized protein n=1 Tax=Flavobacterium branchiicola TaxID=1114875 RepID=A0ABV9PHB9_9FLAO|nr:hypothetical protein [Flavobacterium branchiicola]MBS7256237.1 hypothetical protein [Flavobacterium branchiicola]